MTATSTKSTKQWQFRRTTVPSDRVSQHSSVHTVRTTATTASSYNSAVASATPSIAIESPDGFALRSLHSTTWPSHTATAAAWLPSVRLRASTTVAGSYTTAWQSATADSAPEATIAASPCTTTSRQAQPTKDSAKGLTFLAKE